MKKIIGVRFKKLGKIYFFNPENLNIKKGDKVIVETAQGEEYAEVLIANRIVDDDKIVAPLKKVLRIATNKDTKHYEDCKKKEKEAAKEAAQWAGGSGQPLARNMVLITETKKRLRWLIRTYA